MNAEDESSHGMDTDEDLLNEGRGMNTTTTRRRRPRESDDDAAAAAGDDGEDGEDGDESGGAAAAAAADQRPTKRAKNSNNNAASASASAAAIVTDELQHLASFFVDERRDLMAKASTAHTVTLPKLMERLVGLRSRLEGSPSTGEMMVSLDEIAAAMEAIVVCIYDLLQWITMATPPIATTAVDQNFVMKTAALETINGIEARCVAHLEKIPEHHLERAALTEGALKVGLSAENLQEVLAAFDVTASWGWKMAVNDLLGDCEMMVSFINQHQQFLESSDALASHAMKSMYG